MTALLRAEARKFTSTRSTMLLALLVVTYPLLSVVAVAFAPPGEEVVLGRDSLIDLTRGVAGVSKLAALLLGIMAVTGEYRHGTIVPTCLVTPDRRRLLAAKLASQALIGLALASAATMVAVVAGGAFMAGEGVAVEAGTGLAVTAAAVVAVTVAYAAIGVAVGALVPNQTTAVAGALLWIFAVEEVLPLLFGVAGLRRWLPGGAASRVLEVAGSDPGAGSAAVAVVLLVVVVAVLVTAAVAVMSARDVGEGG
jgi:ABC-2 type transport system permease protein